MVFADAVNKDMFSELQTTHLYGRTLMKHIHAGVNINISCQIYKDATWSPFIQGNLI